MERRERPFVLPPHTVCSFLGRPPMVPHPTVEVVGGCNIMWSRDTNPPTQGILLIPTKKIFVGLLGGGFSLALFLVISREGRAADFAHPPATAFTFRSVSSTNQLTPTWTWGWEGSSRTSTSTRFEISPRTRESLFPGVVSVVVPGGSDCARGHPSPRDAKGGSARFPSPSSSSAVESGSPLTHR